MSYIIGKLCSRAFTWYFFKNILFILQSVRFLVTLRESFHHSTSHSVLSIKLFIWIWCENMMSGNWILIDWPHTWRSVLPGKISMNSHPRPCLSDVLHLMSGWRDRVIDIWRIKNSDGGFISVSEMFSSVQHSYQLWHDVCRVLGKLGPGQLGPLGPVV